MNTATPSLILTMFLLALPSFAQRHPQPPNLKLSTGIDMRGGAITRAATVETETIKLNGAVVTSVSDITDPVYAAILAQQSYTDSKVSDRPTFIDTTNVVSAAVSAAILAQQSYTDSKVSDRPTFIDTTNVVSAAVSAATNAIYLTWLPFFTDGTNFFFITSENVTNKVSITPIED